MTHPTSITRQAIRTPRAAAVAGIAFSSLLLAAMVSSASHYRVIRTTLRTGSPMAPSKPLHSSPSTCSHSPASHFSLVHRGGTGPDRRRRGPVLRDGVLGQWAALRRHAVRHRGGGRRPRAVRGEPSGPGVWSFGRRVSYTLLSAASSDTSPARSTNTSHQPPDHIPTPTSLARRIDKHRSIERSHRTDADEFYRLLDGVVVIDTAEVFNQKLQEWEDFYNFNRPHGGLGGQTPYDRLRQATTKTSA